jgi:hypothetical protein
MAARAERRRRGSGGGPIGLLGARPAPAEAQTAAVTLYQDINYGGASRVLTASVADFTAIGSDNAASSLRVPAGLKVSAYEQANFGGVCENFTADDPDLRNSPICNDRISSLRVGQACQPQVWVFVDINYGSSSMQLEYSVVLGGGGGEYPNLADLIVGLGPGTTRSPRSM